MAINGKRNAKKEKTRIDNMLKSYDLNGHKIEVRYDDHSLHIRNDSALEAFIAPAIEDRARMLAEIVLKEFEQVQGRALDFGVPSLTIEIIAHVYAGHIAGIIEKATDIRLLDQLAEKIIDRCRSIDAGETGHDQDRTVWDVLAPYTRLIVQLLPLKKDIAAGP